jgi:hypothetical protein
MLATLQATPGAASRVEQLMAACSRELKAAAAGVPSGDVGSAPPVPGGAAKRPRGRRPAAKVAPSKKARATVAAAAASEEAEASSGASDTEPSLASEDCDASESGDGEEEEDVNTHKKSKHRRPPSPPAVRRGARHRMPST